VICLENKKNIEEVKITDSVQPYTGIPLYVLLPLCALASTLICTGGWRTGLRATLLGGSLLLGTLAVKKLCSTDTGWKTRTIAFAFFGIIAGLLAASSIWTLELSIGSPDLTNNPYNQDTKNLFFVCPLYGFFMLGCFSLAFNLSRMARFFIVLAGATLANTFCLVDLATPDPNLGIYTLNILRNCVIYYIPCLGNCTWYMLLWIPCAEGLLKLRVNKKTAPVWITTIIIGGVVAYVLFMFIGAMTLSIKPARYFVKHKDTVFNEKLNGIIVFLRSMKYHDFQKKTFYDIPKNTNLNYDFRSKNKMLRVVKLKNSNSLEILKNGKVEKKRALNGVWKYCIVNDSIYYTKERKLFRLKAPDYDKAELILETFRAYRFYISPDENFIIYYKIANMLEIKILCVMNFKSKKILTLEKAGYGVEDIYWVNNLDEIKKPKLIKKKKTKK